MCRQARDSRIRARDDLLVESELEPGSGRLYNKFTAHIFYKARRLVFVHVD